MLLFQKSLGRPMCVDRCKELILTQDAFGASQTVNKVSEVFRAFTQHICISNTNEAILGSCDGHIQHAEVFEDSQAFCVHLLHGRMVRTLLLCGICIQVRPSAFLSQTLRGPCGPNYSHIYIYI